MARKKSSSNEENTGYKFKEIKWSPPKRLTSRAKAAKSEIQSEKKLKKIVQSNLTGTIENQALKKVSPDHQLRYIIIDGSNIAIEHGRQKGNQKQFSCQGIQIVVDFFRARGHADIKVFMPRFRRGDSDLSCPTIDPHILDELEQAGNLCYTPSRFVNRKLVVPYDDRFILKTAAHYNAIIVSNDNYRDLVPENKDWKRIVDTSLLQYSFVGDLFLVADDPLGREGPSLEEFLSKRSPLRCISNNKNNKFD